MPVGYHGPPGPFWIGPTVIAIAIILYVIWTARIALIKWDGRHVVCQTLRALRWSD